MTTAWKPIAKDIVQHFLGRGFQGKAMVVSIDKPTALRMHDKVRKYWKVERERVEKELAGLSDPAMIAIRNRASTEAAEACSKPRTWR